MKKQTKTNHTHLKDSGHTSGKHSALSGASAGRPDKNIQERIKESKENRLISELGLCCHCEAQGYLLGYNKCLAEVRKEFNNFRRMGIITFNDECPKQIEIVQNFIKQLNKFEQKLKEMQK